MSRVDESDALVVLGAGLAGCSAALELARLGHRVIVIDRALRPMMGASRHNEGKLHLGYVYAADPRRETHRLMSSGSLRFFEMIERLTQIPRQRHVTSDRFTYIIPDDSARSADELWAYMQSVDDTVAGLCALYGIDRLPRCEIVEAGVLRRHYSDRVRAAFRTPEIAVDPGRVADIVSASLHAHPSIEFRGGCCVLGVEVLPAGRYRITLRRGEETFAVVSTGIVNALWEDRVRIDAMAGLQSPLRWSQRWKATVMIDVPAGEVDLPSTTGIVGPYGDFVLYGDNRIYVSWYPECRLSMTTTATPAEVRAEVARADRETIRQSALAGLASLMPEVASLDRYAGTTRIGGGFIMAVGDTDIDDPESGLHVRHQIGVEARDRWISVSTGKFCTAPMYGIEAASCLDERVI